MRPIRVLIADDHAIMREGLRTLINSKKQLNLVGEASDGREAVRLAKTLHPDVILMDLVMPFKNGIEAITEIRSENPFARILVLTTFSDDDKVFSAIKAGAAGYLLKDASPEALIQAIIDVHEGQPAIHPHIAQILFKGFNQPVNRHHLENPLTEREEEVLKLVALGLTDQEIASRLIVSHWTIHSHVRNILNKLNLANRTQATLYALREGLVDIK